MTAVLNRSADQNLWSTMPGWGIVADLTPPELSAARKVRKLRKLIAAGLVLVVLLCAAGYTYAWFQLRDARRTADDAAAATLQQQAAIKKFSGITRIEDAVAGARSQVAGVMTNDVDTAKLDSAIVAALPAGASLTTLTVTITPPGQITSETPTLNATGHPPVGTVTLNGKGHQLGDVAALVDRLSAMKGITDVIPGNNAKDSATTTFSIVFSISDQLFTHHYDVTAGGK